MNIKEKLSLILADNYFQAANNECNMFRITDILEDVRKTFVSIDNFDKVEQRLEIRSGENLENDNEFDIIQRLLNQLNELKQEGYKNDIRETAQNEKQQGWLKWLRFFAFELSKANHKNLTFLLQLKIAEQNNDFQKIKKLIPYFFEERWPESLPLFEYFAGLENISEKVKAEIRTPVAQIHLYHFFDMPQALVHIKEIEKLIPNSARVERLYGEYFIQKKEIDKARKHLQKALELDKNDYENYLVLGNLYKAENRCGTAENWYNEGIRTNPGKADLYNRLLLLNENSDYYEKHQTQIDELLEKIIKLENDFTFTAISNAGFVHQKNGNFEKAEEFYKRVIDLFPDRILGYINIGYCYMDKNDFQQAEEALRKAVEIDHNSFDGYWGLVTLFRKKEDWHAVIENLKYCENLREEWLTYIYNDYGNAYEKLGNLENAQKYYLLSLESDSQKTMSQFALFDIAELHLGQKEGIELLEKVRTIKGLGFEDEFHYRAGVICYKNFNYDDAVNHFDKAKPAIENLPVRLEYAGLAYEKAGDNKNAESNFRKAIDAATTNKNKYYNRLAFFLIGLKRCTEAIELLGKAIEIKAEPLYFENLGYANEVMGDLVNAETNYRNALDLAKEGKDTFENRLGIFNYKQQNYKTAIKHYSNAIKLKPKPVYYENIGLAYEYSNDYENAEQSYKKALELAETDKDIYENRLGIFYYNLRDYNKALQHYSNAIALVQKPVYFENTGLAYQYSNDLINAEKNYRKAVELSGPDVDKYYNRLGFFLSQIENYDESVKFLEKSIHINENPTYFENLGFSLEKLGKLDEAEKNYRKALELSSDKKDIYLNRLGVFYFHQKNYNEAIGYYNKAIAYNPKAVYFENLGNAHQLLGDFQQFEKAFLQAAELAPTDGKYYFQLGWRSLEQFKDTAKSKFYLNKALEIFSKTPETEPEELLSIQFMGAAYQQEGNLEKAEEFFMEAYQIDSTNDMVFNFLGKINFEKKQYQKALEFYEKALDLKSDKPGNIKNVAEVLEVLGEKEKAIDLYKSGLKLAPWFNENIGKIYYRAEQYEQAENYFRNAIDIYPNNHIYLENLGLTLQKLGKYTDALDIFTDALSLAPFSEKHFFNNYIGNCWYSLGNWDKAATHYQEALEKKPAKLDAQVYFNNLMLALKNGNKHDEAIEIIENKLVDNPNDTPLLNHLGLLFIEIGNYEKALNCFKRNLELKPEIAVYHDNMAFTYEKLDQPEKAAEVYLNAIRRFPDNSSFTKNIEKCIAKITDAEKRDRIIDEFNSNKKSE